MNEGSSLICGGFGVAQGFFGKLRRLPVNLQRLVVGRRGGSEHDFDPSGGQTRVEVAGPALVVALPAATRRLEPADRTQLLSGAIGRFSTCGTWFCALARPAASTS